MLKLQISWELETGEKFDEWTRPIELAMAEKELYNNKSIVKVLMGKYGRVPALPFKLYNRNEKDIIAFIDETLSYLLNLEGRLKLKHQTF